MIKTIENKKKHRYKLKMAKKWNVVLAFTGIIADIFKMLYKTVCKNVYNLWNILNNTGRRQLRILSSLLTIGAPGMYDMLAAIIYGCCGE